MPFLDTIIIGALYVYIFVVIVYLILENRETSTTFSWLLVFIFLPVVGIIFYYLFGQRLKRKTKKTFIRQDLSNRLSDSHDLLIKQQKQVIKNLHEKYISSENRKLIRLLYRNSDSILTRLNAVKVFFSGKEKFDVLIDDLKKAQHYIHMEYFIWKADNLTAKVIDVIREKAASGVQVRILYDSVGNHLPGRYLKQLRRSGILIYPYYNFLSPLKLHTLNHRNHRKMIIIDGFTGYLGGMNMGEEYITGGKRFPAWRDTHIRVLGESVVVLQGIFSVSWTNTTKEILDLTAIIPDQLPELVNTHIQVTASGPDSQWESIKQLYFLLISSADQSISIQTPYFIPDASIVMALKTAALSGIDVRIMLTGWVDKRLPYWAAFTFLKDLLEAGVRFYYYTGGFMHAKTIVVDTKICSVGTANMDIRSFTLNYEINALIYDEDVANTLQTQFTADLDSSMEFTLDDYNRLSRFKRLRNSLAKLFAPLL
ncbi:MAG: cardiolipin synthase [Deltaproteobacteria bacterium]|uniref:cardiolipin synthase n=1 Tax=Desulfobacula sp. TaxID=2593537 RepID=UPI0019CD0429|nr:cardiolipin synthase [Candidatus Desulfobacula maris]MBL6995390.1 cardiolipin synthase [Desulfobacula sp.]